jgi:hypothetical protein
LGFAAAVQQLSLLRMPALLLLALQGKPVLVTAQYPRKTPSKTTSKTPSTLRVHVYLTLHDALMFAGTHVMR